MKSKVWIQVDISMRSSPGGLFPSVSAQKAITAFISPSEAIIPCAFPGTTCRRAAEGPQQRDVRRNAIVLPIFREGGA